MPHLPPSKRRRLSPPIIEDVSRHSSSEEDESSSLQADFSKHAAQWTLEQDYERRPRKQDKIKITSRLPIKTSQGEVEYLQPLAEDNDDASSFGSLEDDTPPTEASEGDDTLEEDEVEKLSPKQQILQAKEDLAKIASLINGDPEDHIGSLHLLAEITSSRNATVTKLGLATQMAIYKDLIPGYRIRPLSEEDTTIRITKEVRKLRAFEQSIVVGYQKYVKELARIAALQKSSSSEEAAGLSTVAFSCACTLLKAVPHFNFRSELLKIVIDRVGRKPGTPDFVICRETLEQLFEEDDEGNASLEAVQMLGKMIRARRYHVDESVLNTLLHLRLLSEFHQKASNSRISKGDDGDRSAGRLSKKEREFRTKRERKLAKERKSIDKEMKEADAIVTHEERDQRQGETLKAVFSLYFRILKERSPRLMGAVLEGLVKYAHMINQEFFGDLLESLKELIAERDSTYEAENGEEDGEEAERDPRDSARESLLCVITAFALLQGQDASAAATSLGLDLNFFVSHLYRTLFPAAMNPDIELSSKSLHLPDPDAAAQTSKARTKVNVQTTIVLLIRSLQAVLLPANTRSVPPIRLAAFCKQVMTSSLHLPEKSSTAMLGLLNQVAKEHRKKISALWNTEERRGDGVFNPLKGDIEGSNPFASTIWEGELLRLHYCPTVRDGVKNLESAVAMT